MRDLALVIICAGLFTLTALYPFVGVYVWTWLTLMDPHRLTYGFARGLPLNMVVAVLTIGGAALSRERNKLPLDGFAVSVLIFGLWISITTLAAPSPDFTDPLWSRNIKTLILVFVTLWLINSRIRIHGLVWIIAISIAFFGVKGGGFVLLTGGSNHVLGPEGTMIEDNNCLALACVMVIPLLNYLRLHAEKRMIRLAIMGAMLLTIASVLGSYSRGGLIALASMIFLLWLKSRAKLAIAFSAIVVAGLAIGFMPQQYMDRISTISDAQHDESVRGRFDAWQVAWQVALHRPLGAGFDGPRQPKIWNKYLPGVQNRASHSIYFMVLGEHGFIGFGIYLWIIISGWGNFAKSRKLCRGNPDLVWAQDLTAALQASIVGFLIGGAALPMAYYDEFFLILTVGAATRHLLEANLNRRPTTDRTIIRERESSSAEVMSTTDASKLPIH